jgi:alginate O-acetyltransferase complex protein AlgI
MCWKMEYILLIVISTLIDYFAALQMGKTNRKKERKKYLILSICSNLGMLFLFKYLNFFNESLRFLFNNFNIFYDSSTFNLLLPVGISFYTFQTLSYTIDVYNGKKEPEKNLGIFALYVSFFPQLVAGPIERATHLLPKLHEQFDFDYKRVTSGVKLMLWGFFKKCVIADRLGFIVNQAYNNPESPSVSLVFATYFFAYQIYCDFSGYSDIAIGASRIFGYDLMVNFNRPYFSKSIKEFWKRWHISLSTWFKDYVYIPLGGNRTVKQRWWFNLFITFVISGLWHGANWTFILWGSIHGFYLLSSIWIKKWQKPLIKKIKLSLAPLIYKYLQVISTFHLVLFAWIFFRANTVSDAFFIIKKIAVEVTTWNFVVLYKTEFLYSILFIAFLEIVHFIQRKHSI